MTSFKLNASVCAAALLLTACGEQAPERDERVDITTVPERAEGPASDDASTEPIVAPAERLDETIPSDPVPDIYVFGTGEFALEEMIGEPINGSDGTQIATVSDIMLGSDGQIDSVVFSHGGLAGLGGDRGLIAYSDVTITLDEEQEPRLQVSMTEDQIEQVSEWEQSGADDYRLVGELMGTTISLADSDENVRVVDFLTTLDGQVSQIVIANGPLDELLEREVVFAFSSLGPISADAAPVLNATPDEIDAALSYEEFDD